MFYLQQYSGQGGTVSADGNSSTIEKLTLEEGSVLACQWQRIVVDEKTKEIHLSYGEQIYFSGLIKIQIFSLYIIYFFQKLSIHKKKLYRKIEALHMIMFQNSNNWTAINISIDGTIFVTILTFPVIFNEKWLINRGTLFTTFKSNMVYNCVRQIITWFKYANSNKSLNQNNATRAEHRSELRFYLRVGRPSCNFMNSIGIYTEIL